MNVITIECGKKDYAAVHRAMLRLARERRNLHCHYTFGNRHNGSFAAVFQAHDQPAGIVEDRYGIAVCWDSWK